jgi:translation initiation factor IF-1
LAKEELLELDGVVDEVLSDSRYRVTLELSVYDLSKRRVNFRAQR